MSWSDTDIIRMAAFFAAIFINRQAVFVLAVELCVEFLFYYSPNGFIASLFMACAYSTAAAVNINLKSQIRHVLLCIGALNWLAAVDYLVAPDAETYLYICYPWIINLLDLIILCHLFGNWRPQNVGAMGILGKSFNRSALRL